MYVLTTQHPLLTCMNKRSFLYLDLRVRVTAYRRVSFTVIPSIHNMRMSSAYIITHDIPHYNRFRYEINLLDRSLGNGIQSTVFAAHE